MPGSGRAINLHRHTPPLACAGRSKHSLSTSIRNRASSNDQISKKPIFRIVSPEAPLAHKKFVHVATLPTHRGLQHVVQPLPESRPRAADGTRSMGSWRAV